MGKGMAAQSGEKIIAFSAAMIPGSSASLVSVITCGTGFAGGLPWINLFVPR